MVGSVQAPRAPLPRLLSAKCIALLDKKSVFLGCLLVDSAFQHFDLVGGPGYSNTETSMSGPDVWFLGTFRRSAWKRPAKQRATRRPASPKGVPFRSREEKRTAGTVIEVVEGYLSCTGSPTKPNFPRY